MALKRTLLSFKPYIPVTQQFQKLGPLGRRLVRLGCVCQLNSIEY